MIISKYNQWKNTYELELFPGEEVCPKCKGIGIKGKLFEEYGLHAVCRKCRGEGKIDWITKIMRQ
jgi:DnaJ-class molecular chaperone